jgi:hypothetical protein
VGAGRVLGYLPGYAGEEGLHSGERYFLLQAVRGLFGEVRGASVAYVAFALVVMAALGAWCLLKRESGERDYAGRAALLATAFTVLLSPHYTWYFAWLAAFLCVVRVGFIAPLMCLTVAAFMLYGTWLGDAPADMLRLNACIYLPPAVLLVASYLKRAGVPQSGRDGIIEVR